MNWADKMRGKKLIVCLGAGGVGKTSMSAALGMLGAEQDNKTLVVTIDPAKRLADALHMKLGTAPQKVSKNLDAMMLDMGAAWDDLVARMATSKMAAKKILSNRFYHYLSREMAGSQEFVACETLYTLATEHDYDWIVLDTPPSQHVLDFLDAPSKVIPSLGIKFMSLGGGLTARILSKFVSGSFLTELSNFLLVFSDLYPSLTKRAKQFQELLAGPEVLYVLVMIPQAYSIETGMRLKKALEERGLRVDVMIVNRVISEVDESGDEKTLRAVKRHNKQAQLEQIQIEMVREMALSDQMLVLFPKLSQDAGLNEFKSNIGSGFRNETHGARHL